MICTCGMESSSGRVKKQDWQLLVREMRKRIGNEKRVRLWKPRLVTNSRLNFVLEAAPCVSRPGKHTLCRSGGPPTSAFLFLIFPIAGLISISNSGTFCGGTVYYRLMKAANDSGHPGSNPQHYPDLSLSGAFHQVITLTGFREHSALPPVAPWCLSPRKGYELSRAESHEDITTNRPD